MLAKAQAPQSAPDSLWQLSKHWMRHKISLHEWPRDGCPPIHPLKNAIDDVMSCWSIPSGLPHGAQCVKAPLLQVDVRKREESLRSSLNLIEEVMTISQKDRFVHRFTNPLSSLIDIQKEWTDWSHRSPVPIGQCQCDAILVVNAAANTPLISISEIAPVHIHLPVCHVGP